MFVFRNVLHKYANEDVSLGAWFIGLDVEHIDDRRLCCGTPPGEYFSCVINHYILKKSHPRLKVVRSTNQTND